MARARATAAAKSVDELVHHALKLAATNPKAKWTGRSAKALFNENEANHKAAMERCLNASRPLLRQVKDGGVLTAAGFEEIAGTLPEDQVVALAKSVAEGQPPKEKADFLQGVIGRTPAAAPELNPMLQEAIAAEEVEAEARIAAAAKRKATEEATKQAVERFLKLVEERRRNRLDALRREWEAEGQQASELPDHKPKTVTPVKDGGETFRKPEPVTAADKNFRREVAERLVSAWLYNTRHNKAEAATALERLLRAVDGVVPIGAVGDVVRFDGRIHECERPVSDDEQVRVTRLGWELAGDVGAPLQRALVG